MPARRRIYAAGLIPSRAARWHRPNSLGGGGRRGAREGRLDPLAVLPAVHPGATKGDPFTGADLGGMAHHRHQLAVAAGGA
ncbi:MAG: hypothetical protein ACK587_15675 [Cyanobacteriota bacterium]